MTESEIRRAVFRMLDILSRSIHVFVVVVGMMEGLQMTVVIDVLPTLWIITLGSTLRWDGG